MPLFGRLLSDDARDDSGKGRRKESMADSTSCYYSCSIDWLVPVGLWRRMADVVGSNDDRTCFTFCYRRIKSSNIHSISILVRQSIQTILDIIWIRPTAPPNGGDSYLVFSRTLKEPQQVSDIVLDQQKTV